MSGGMNTYIRHLAAHLARVGVGVDIFTRGHGYLGRPTMTVAPGVILHHVDVRSPAPGRSRDMSGSMEEFSEKVMKRIARDRSSLVVHSHYWASAEVGAFLGEVLDAPHVHTHHSFAECRHPLSSCNDCRCRQEARTAQKADLLIASTDSETNHIVHSLGANEDRVAVVTPGVDRRLFHRPRDSNVLSRSVGVRTVVFAGRLTRSKGVDVALRAYELLARSLGGVRMVVAGGPREPFESSGARRLSVSGSRVADVVFLGKVHQARLASIFWRAALVLVPSRRETFGFVALEAQASGAPVLASSVSGLMTTVGDGSGGLRLSTHAPEDWARAAGDILEDRETFDRLRHAGPRFADRFRWSDAASETLALFGRMV